jgi:hypothetical protein
MVRTARITTGAIPLLLLGISLLLVRPAFATPCTWSGTRQTLTGTVRKVEWKTPEVFYSIDVKDGKSGKVTQFVVNMGPPHLLPIGNPSITRDTIKVGDQLTVTGEVDEKVSRLGLCTPGVLVALKPAASSPPNANKR